MRTQRDSITIGGATAKPGKFTVIQLPLARLHTGQQSTLPIGVLHGAQPGPTVWLSAAIHGDELNGVSIIRQVLQAIQPRSFSGTIIAAPVVNPMGLLQESRYLPDRRDLNRSFPGSRRGSSAAQLAHLFMEEIVTRSDVGLDLHTGSGGRTNLPQVRCDLDDPETRRLAYAFAAPLVLHSRHRDGSLRAAAHKLGKPTLLFEAGEAGRFDETSIAVGVRGVFRVLAEMGMWEGELISPSVVPQTSRESHWVRCHRTGFCEMQVKLGAGLEKGDIIALVYDALGESRSEVRASKSGVLIGHLTTALVHRGDAIAHVATVSDSPPSRVQP